MGITITLIIVIMTSIISYQAFTNQSMKQKLIFHPVSVKERGEYYRFLTHGFLHGDYMHLIINMYVLYVFGEQIESIFVSEGITFLNSNIPMESFGPVKGRIIFLLLYFGAVIFSSIPQYFRHQENNYYMALGASGGTSAIVFAYILFVPWEWFTFPPLPGIVLGIAYLLYSSYMDKRGGDNIGHNAHFWGAVYGLVFTIAAAGIFAPDMLEVFKFAFLQGPHWP
ncbi:MAG: membrane associated rhomboid family serine protease [Saprospiraceae bacterium]|jgi:membrane associated rhomboid family serine protease